MATVQIKKLKNEIVANFTSIYINRPKISSVKITALFFTIKNVKQINKKK